ncbi:MAG: sulfatase/phosphatase domain-containing protein, partial [Pseudomonadales bacterium]
GGSVLPSLASDAAHTGHKGILIEDEIQRVFGGFDQPVRLRTLLTPRWRMTHYLGADWGELYDLERDPHEVENLWFDAAHVQVRCDLNQALIQKVMELSSRSPLPTRIA